MTKKVLISLTELNKIYVNSLGNHYVDGVSIEHWFDSQPDVMPIVQDYEATKNLFKGAITVLDEGLSKLEAAFPKIRKTGGEDGQ